MDTPNNTCDTFDFYARLKFVFR